MKTRHDWRDFIHLWGVFYSECADSSWDDPEYCDEQNKEEWFKQWLVDEGFIVWDESDNA